MDTKASNRVALIVGADGEIGAAMASRFAAAGARLALAGTTREKLEALQGRVSSEGARAEALGFQPRDPSSIADCVRRVLERFGRIDILVNDAAAAINRPLPELTAAEVAASMEVVLAAPFHFMREVVPGMRRHGFGRVVNISELNYLGLPDQANAAAARAGLFGLTRSIALESARDGVTVNTVVKGDIATPATSEAEKERLSGGIPVRRAGTTADVARAVSFFAADSTKYVTGQTFFVCGGKSAFFSMSM